jgi:ferric-dicitrate binding protein FerR (iron transport regulator)
MTCDEAINLINARLDGEIARADAVALQEHLASCADCRNEAKAVATQDVKLRDSFASHQAAAKRVADRVVAELHRKPKIRRIAPWWSLAVSMAAGFAIAWMVLRPWQHAPPIAVRPATSPVQVVGHLTVASGPVECLRPADRAWFTLPTGGAIVAGSQLRTGPGVRCELQIDDGPELRLNENTQIALASGRRFDLISGEAWSTADDQATETFEAGAAAVTFTCPGTQSNQGEGNGTSLIVIHPGQIDVNAESRQTKMISLKGSVRANASGQEKIVGAGSELSCSDGQLGQMRPVENLVSATSWLNEILILKGRDNPELDRRIDDLLAQIGATKIDFMYEDEIRGLGDHCVIPLVRYIKSDRSNGQEAKRATAAKIVSDVASPWAIPELLHLLNDRNGDVRASAATALQRLTGQTLGRSPQAWRDDSPLLCEPTEQAWQQWWQSNREKFPGASTQPTIIVKKPQMLQKG